VIDGAVISPAVDIAVAASLVKAMMMDGKPSRPPRGASSGGSEIGRVNVKSGKSGVV